jgi:rhodanese-related sulfurtransferase
MGNNGFNKSILIAAMITVIGLTPVLLYWFTQGQYSIRPDQAKILLNSPNSNTLLVDIRSSRQYQNDHIDGAVSWPLDDILKLSPNQPLPQAFQGKTLLLICNAGVSSIHALKHLKSIEVNDAKSVRGGMQEWIANSACNANCIFQRFQTRAGQYSSFPTYQSPYYEQVAQVVSGFVVKPIYSILALAISVILWKRPEPDLTALKWSMIFFFIGENFCAANYLLFSDKSYLSEYLHGFGMLLAFSFVTYALFEGIDSRILHLSDPDKKCAAIGLCKKCIKYEKVPCGLKRIFYLVIPAMMIIALMPLFADWKTISYNTLIFGKDYNYSHFIVYQQFERLYCPLAAIALLSISFLVLVFKKQSPISSAKLFFAAGFGPLGFGMMRTMLSGFYSENLVWSNVWEEGTEFMYIIGVCFVLWIFKRGIFTGAD